MNRRMPVVFVGHGSPMNIIEDNLFTQTWKEMGERIPPPKGILCISAHWYEPEEKVSTALMPDTIYDFYGFPPALYTIKYPAPGAPKLAGRALDLFHGSALAEPMQGLDHGAWSVLYHMYPKANIPVCQLSVNAAFTPDESYQAGRKLAKLREEGVLILGSGNVVHNLSLVNWQLEGGYPWADDFDLYIIDALQKGEHDKAIHFDKHPEAGKAFYYRDHYDPLLYVLGASQEGEPVEVLNAQRVLGSLSMTSFIIGDITGKKE